MFKVFAYSVGNNIITKPFNRLINKKKGCGVCFPKKCARGLKYMGTEQKKLNTGRKVFKNLT